ncbi:MAG: hypothetical protein RMY30_038220 [Nostoc sp. CmiSLP01]|nr:hypothetical protein [Nostoc sp. CmiSLP01]MDZ8287564.1 hypothetical protein [Nostoc sp. ChiSLP01]
MFKNLLLLVSLMYVIIDYTNFSFSRPSFAYNSSGSNRSNLSGKVLAQQTDNPPILEREGYLFEFRGCKSTGDNTTCDFAVVNKQQRRYLSICAPKTKVVDSAGRELIASQVFLGAKKAGGCVRNQLSRDVPTKGSVVFDGLIGSDIRLFDISAYKFNVEFIQGQQSQLEAKNCKN